MLNCLHYSTKIKKMENKHIKKLIEYSCAIMNMHRSNNSEVEIFMKNHELGSLSDGDDGQTGWDTTQDVKFAGEQRGTERDFVKFEDLEPLFDDKTSFIMGHGTGTAGDGHEVVDSILETGLRGYQALDAAEPDKDKVAGSTDLTDTAMSLFSAIYGDKPDMANIRDKLDHWKHRDAQNIILMKFPVEFANTETSVNAEHYRPFFVQKRDSFGQMRNFVDPRFIIGSYDRETGLVEMNENFEATLSDEFRSEMEQRLEEARNITRQRVQADEEKDKNFPWGQSDAADDFEARDDVGNEGAVVSLAGEGEAEDFGFNDEELDDDFWEES